MLRRVVLSPCKAPQVSQSVKNQCHFMARVRPSSISAQWPVLSSLFKSQEFSTPRAVGSNPGTRSELSCWDVTELLTEVRTHGSVKEGTPGEPQSGSKHSCAVLCCEKRAQNRTEARALHTGLRDSDLQEQEEAVSRENSDSKWR